MLIYDAENKILGRLASIIAKKLLEGEEIIVVNCEKAILAGDPKAKVKKYLERIWAGDPKKGPFFPRYPNEIFRRTVRGMLPWKKKKGREAFKRLKVFIGLPDEFKNKELINVKEVDASKLDKTKCKYITLEELSLQIGAKKRW